MRGQMETKPKADIMILTPGHSLMGPYVDSLLKTIRALDSVGLTWGYSNDYASHVADAREVTLSGTRENNILDNRPFGGDVEYKKLMWIDSDIAWEPEDVLRLYDSDKDIISGAYMAASGQVMWQKKALGAFYSIPEVLDMKEVTEIEGTGFGFVCIKYGVFESLSRPWFQSTEGKVNVNNTEYKFNIIGEDLSFCERVRQVGFKIYADPNVKVTHHKMQRLAWEVQP